ncbi:MAG TPA: MG2 domain-containing protein, partial [Pyrinomonadaceae bacterium]|nr:MG2 domain-containing protein [Pyrinomonadaceae bacterium]
MKTLYASLLLLALSAAHHAAAQQPDYERLKAEAERHYAARSYALARDTYARAEGLELPAPERRWLLFRLADTTWRAQAATATADSTTYERAERRLEELVNAVEREDERDRVWAEAQESLGDLFWTRRDSRDWPRAWPRYQQALEWWAGARDIETARARYLRIVRTVARPPDVDQYYYYGYHGNTLPQDVLENAVKIAHAEDERAHAHYLLAMSLRHHHDAEQRRRTAEEFEAALKPGKRTDWYDDALYFYAEWAAQQGRSRVNENGDWQAEPDFARALELFRRLVAEHREGESRFWEQAKQNVELITKPAVSVGVSNVFLPDSEVSFALNWRNVRRVEFALYRVDLTRDTRAVEDIYNPAAWLGHVGGAGRERVRGWAKETGDRGEHLPGNEQVRVEGKLPVGAYLLEASAAGVAVARELVLVTDTALVLKTSGRRALAYFCDALTGAPVAGARVKVWEQFRREGADKWEWRAAERQTDADGLALFELDRGGGPHYQKAVFATAAHGERQAFSNGYSQPAPADSQPWRVYAFTDRPAYRPGETVRWKLIARRRDPSGAYTTPAEQSLRFRVNDPRGAVVKEGEARLNAFGGAWGELELTDKMPLGEYHVTFMSADGNTHVGGAQLFRLEEYKLPEFKVSVQTPEENGRRKAFRLGEKVEVKIQADYYFGGPVSGGTVEVVVRQNPFWHYYRQPREFPWYYEDDEQRRHYYGGGGSVVKRETVKLDARGQATLTFDTPRNNAQDYEYQIEARATDSSRREVTAAGAVRVTRQRYYAYPRPRHQIYRPQDRISLDVKTADANDQPVSVEGRVQVTRNYWYEIWLAPDGREVSGDELRRLRERAGQPFPPPGRRGERPWQLKFRGYKHEEILTQSLRTNAQGDAEFSFTAEREGFYRVAWVSDDKGSPVKSETAVWVATNATTDTGFRSGGLEIVVDRDTFQPGQTAPVMLSTNAPGRYVLFAVEAEDLDSYRLVRLEGTAKLIAVEVEARHAPNLYLSGTTVADAQIHADTKQVVVPPVGQFLNVEVKADREHYEPREEGTLTVTTRDREGRPVAAEVALGLVDESVFYIQSDYAADPRRFYYGEKRRHLVQTQSTFQQRAYARLVAAEGGVTRAAEQQEFSVQPNEITELPINGRNYDRPYAQLSTLAPGTAADGAGAGAGAR